jgi:uncharacterized protein YukE
MTKQRIPRNVTSGGPCGRPDEHGVDMVDLLEVPGTPAWDQGAADEVVAHAEVMRAQLGDLVRQLDTARWLANANWSGLAKAAFDDRYLEVQRLVARLRQDLEAVPARVADGRDEYEDARRLARYRLSTPLGVAADLFDWLTG